VRGTTTRGEAARVTAARGATTSNIALRSAATRSVGFSPLVGLAVSTRVAILNFDPSRSRKKWLLGDSEKKIVDSYNLTGWNAILTNLVSSFVSLILRFHKARFFSSFPDPTMQRVSPNSTIWRNIVSKVRKNLFSINDPFAVRSFSAVPVAAAAKLHKQDIPCDFQKWGSVGFFRTSKFASGFNPLQPKPLDSIVDVHRLKDRYPEDIASIWDDVMSHWLLVLMPFKLVSHVDSVALHNSIYLSFLWFALRATNCFCLCLPFVLFVRLVWVLGSEK